MTRTVDSICLRKLCPWDIEMGAWVSAGGTSPSESHLDQSASGGKTALGPSGLYKQEEQFFPGPGRRLSSPNQTTAAPWKGRHDSESRVTSFLHCPGLALQSTSITVLQASTSIYLWQVLDEGNTTRPTPNLSAREPFSPSCGRKAEWVHEIPSTGSQDKGGVQDEFCCSQCLHSPVHSDLAHTPKITSLPSWQDSTQY